MQDIFLNLALAVTAAFLTHEVGHYLMARCFGKRLRFWFEWGWLFGVVPVPRGVWSMPVMASWKQRLVALAGFGAELTCSGIGAFLDWPWLLLVASCHLLAYPFYAGNASDFKWL